MLFPRSRNPQGEYSPGCKPEYILADNETAYLENCLMSKQPPTPKRQCFRMRNPNKIPE